MKLSKKNQTKGNKKTKEVEGFFLSILELANKMKIKI